MAKHVFTVKKNGEDIELAVLKPNNKTHIKAQEVYNQVFAAAVRSGAYLRDTIDKLLKDHGLWDDERENAYQDIRNRINNGEKKLAGGGIKLAEAKNIALDIRRARAELITLLTDRNKYDSHTAEAQAENARFNYLVSSCVVYNDTGEPYFKSYDDYLERSDEQTSIECATKFANVFYNLSDDFEQNRPENKFLKKYKFVDEKLRLVNKEGHLIDAEGRLIDEDGRYIKYVGDKKVFIDIDGNEVDEEGNYVADFSPFLDDEGNPIVEESVTAES